MEAVVHAAVSDLQCELLPLLSEGGVSTAATEFIAAVLMLTVCLNRGTTRSFEHAAQSGHWFVCALPSGYDITGEGTACVWTNYLVD